MSASGPFGPIFFGVWQSWQPPPMINILPRSTCDIAGAAAGDRAGARRLRDLRLVRRATRERDRNHEQIDSRTDAILNTSAWASLLAMNQAGRSIPAI